MYNAIQNYHISHIRWSPYPWFRFPNYMMSIHYLEMSINQNAAVEKNHNVTHSDYKIFKHWWIFLLWTLFRNTSANWRRWPRSGRSCAHVWTIFQGDSTTLQTDWSLTSWSDPPATETSQPLSVPLYGDLWFSFCLQKMIYPHGFY